MPEANGDFELDRAPLGEMVLGMQFAPLAGWSVLHYGLYWESIRQAFPKFELKDPLLDPSGLASMQAAVSAPGGFLPPRVWFIDESDAYVLQLQHDRMLLNWRRRQDSTYPRFRNLYSRLATIWSEFVQFSEKAGLGTPRVSRCENSYYNYVDTQALQSAGTPFEGIFPVWHGGLQDYLGNSPTLAFSLTVALPDVQGQTTTSLQPAVVPNERKVLLQVQFTTAIVPAASDMDAVLAALELGHKWNVRAFREFTSEHAQQLWGRR